MACQSSTIISGPRFAPRSAPVTFWYLIVLAVSWLASYLVASSYGSLAKALVYNTADLTARPWSLVTWPLVMSQGSPFFAFLMGYMLWWTGADAEQWWGTRIHAAFLVVVSLATALLLTLASALTGISLLAAGPGLLLAACFTIWCLRNFRAPIMLLIVPATGWIVLIITVLGAWMSYPPFPGLFATAGACGLPALYYFYGHRLHGLLGRRGDGSQRGDGTQRKSERKREAARKQEERERRDRDERVKQIFERSGLHLVDDGSDKKK